MIISNNEYEVKCLNYYQIKEKIISNIREFNEGLHKEYKSKYKIVKVKIGGRGTYYCEKCPKGV